VQGDWLVPLPAGLTTRQAMAIGTAGYTAMLCVMALQGHGLTPDSGDILVTGANGGVGSVAVALLSKLGYRVVASTGRVSEADAEGAGRGRGHRPRRAVGTRQAAGQGALGRRGRFGGQPHAGQCLRRHQVPRRGGRLRPGAGHGLPGQRRALHPARRHALRHRQRDGAEGLREQAWARLAQDLDGAKLDSLVNEIPLAGAMAAGADILAGKVRGRLVVDVNA
jgi:acrylyl-CoA reductase (NADPH)